MDLHVMGKSKTSEVPENGVFLLYVANYFKKGRGD